MMQWIDKAKPFADSPIRPQEETSPSPNPKYQRKVKDSIVDVYDVLWGFGVQCPATQHAIKKLLCPGQRGYKDKLQDLNEARSSIDRAIQIHTGHNKPSGYY